MQAGPQIRNAQNLYVFHFVFKDIGYIDLSFNDKCDGSLWRLRCEMIEYFSVLVFKNSNSKHPIPLLFPLSLTLTMY